MKFLGLALSLVIGFSSTANAGIFVEPYAGYSLGKFEDAGGTKGTINGSVIGGRLGGEMAMLFFGGDYSMSVGGKYKQDGSTTSNDSDVSQLYGVIGANLPIIRAWAGYGLMNEVKTKSAFGDTKSNGGSHIKLGLGFKVIPMLSLNVEYFISDYKTDVDSLGAKTDSALETTAVLISASVPFSF